MRVPRRRSAWSDGDGRLFVGAAPAREHPVREVTGNADRFTSAAAAASSDSLPIHDPDPAAVELEEQQEEEGVEEEEEGWPSAGESDSDE